MKTERKDTWVSNPRHELAMLFALDSLIEIEEKIGAHKNQDEEEKYWQAYNANPPSQDLV